MAKNNARKMIDRLNRECGFESTGRAGSRTYCIAPAGHSGWHVSAYAGTDEPAFYTGSFTVQAINVDSPAFLTIAAPPSVVETPVLFPNAVSLHDDDDDFVPHGVIGDDGFAIQ